MRVKKFKAWAIILLIALAFINATRIRSGYFDLNEINLQDEAFIQIKQTFEFIQSGGAVTRALENPIFVTHLVRVAIFIPFSYLGSLGHGQGLEYVLLILISLPVVMRYYKRSNDIIYLAPLVLPFLISYRSFLAALAIGYVVIAITSKGNILFLLFGVTLSLLSTAVMVQSSLLILIYRKKISCLLRNNPVAIVPLIAFLGITLLVTLVKIQGFVGGLDGYTSEYGSDGIQSAITRSTLVIGLAKGSLRGYLSLAIALLLIISLVRLGNSRNKELKTYFRILSCLAPGLLFEGLGIVSILFPILWMVRGVHLIELGEFNRGYIRKSVKSCKATYTRDDCTSV